MAGVKLQYQAIVFANASDIAPSPDHVVRLVESFRDKEMVPGTFQEIGQKGPAPVSRLQLASATGEWVIRFASSRISIERNPTDPTGANLGEIGVFCASASDFYARILQAYSKRANRLAVTSNLMLPEMTPAELSEVYRKLLKPPLFYREHEPFEWDWRSASKATLDLWDPDERLNVITTVGRRQGQLGMAPDTAPFDRVQVSLDINTVPDSVEYRFELSQITGFFDHVPVLHDKLLGEVLEFIDGHTD